MLCTEMALLLLGDLRGLVLAADRLANVHGFLGRKRSLRQVQLLLPLVAEGQFPGLEEDTWPPVGGHLRGETTAVVLGSAELFWDLVPKLLKTDFRLQNRVDRL